MARAARASTMRPKCWSCRPSWRRNTWRPRKAPSNSRCGIRGAADDYALASRLSYFLWDSMPDEMLFDLAGTGKLRDPAVLQEEIARMIRSPKAMAFIESFVTQWLGTRELGREFAPDPGIFPN